MPYLLRYKVRPSSGWIHSEPLAEQIDAMEKANKLVVAEECCKVEVYQLIATGTPVAPQVKIEWTKNENGERISQGTGRLPFHDGTRNGNGETSVVGYGDGESHRRDAIRVDDRGSHVTTN
jgi:hypothetical protein